MLSFTIVIKQVVPSMYQADYVRYSETIKISINNYDY